VRPAAARPDLVTLRNVCMCHFHCSVSAQAKQHAQHTRPSTSFSGSGRMLQRRLHNFATARTMWTLVDTFCTLPVFLAALVVSMVLWCCQQNIVYHPHISGLHAKALAHRAIYRLMRTFKQWRWMPCDDCRAAAIMLRLAVSGDWCTFINDVLC
jgi:hypothetical protein